MKITKKLYDDYKGYISYLCKVRVLDSPEDAEQAVWLQIHRAKEWEEGIGALPSYIKEIAIHTICSFLTGQRRQKMKWAPQKIAVRFESLNGKGGPNESELENSIPGIDVDFDSALDYYTLRTLARKVLPTVKFEALFNPEESRKVVNKSTFEARQRTGLVELRKYLK
jgi:DNA-directed RNA polymerase specialized sigma24 family protein